MSDTPTDEPPTPTPEEGSDPSEESPSDNKDWQAEARRKGKENSGLRARLKEAEAAAEAAKLAGMSEIEKQMAEAEERGRLKAAEEYVPQLRQMVLADAARGKLLDPRVAARLAPDHLDLSDPADVKAAIDGIVKEFPALAVTTDDKAPTHSGGTFDQGVRGTPVQSKQTVNDLLMESLGFQNGQS